MNKKRFSTRVFMSLLVALMFLTAFGVCSLAADTYANKNLAYGEIVPTDSKLLAQKYSYTFYGDKGEMYFMRMSKGVKNSYFSIEIYSDAKYQNRIRTSSKAYDSVPGNKSLTVTWKFDDTVSGTYYGRCYSYLLDANGNKTIDSSSLKTFKINVDRITKRAVTLKKLSNSSSGPQISWNTVPTATKYYVYRRAANESGWKLIKTLGANATSFADTTAKSGVNYTYTVRCSYEKYLSLYNKNGLSILCLSTPKISIAGSGSAGYAMVKWDAVPGAKGYYIYRKGGNLSSSTWTRIATVNNAKAVYYVDKTAKSTDWRYTYTVIAFNGKNISAFDYNGVNFNYMLAPKITKLYSDFGGMKIEWSASDPNIKRYYIYRKNGNNWKFIAQTTNKYYVDSTAVSGKTYTYTVKALSATNAGGYSANGSTAQFLATAKINPLTFNTANSSVVSWKPVSGATGYEIYRKVGNAKYWTLVKKVTNTKTCTFYDTYKKSSGTVFTYTVRAYNSKVRAYYDVDGVSAMFLSMPVFTSQQIPSTDSALCIETKWQPVNGATGYNVYRRAPGGSWVLLKRNTAEFNYLDTTCESGIKYEYTVRALNSVGNMSAYLPKTAIAVTVPVLNSVVVSEDGVKLDWNALENATAYNVYRISEDGNTKTKLATVETNGYTDTSDEGKTLPFYYTVSAVFGDTESASYDGLPNFTKIDISASFVSATDTKSSLINVTFKCDGAEKVEIYKSVNDEPPILISESPVTEASFEDTEIEEGNSYTYMVKTSETGKVDSVAYATAKYPHPPLNAPVITDISGDWGNGEPSVTVTWNEVEFADEYVVLRSDGNGEWAEIGTVKATADPEENETPVPQSDEITPKTYTFTDENASAEILYGYKIRAVATASERASSDSEPVQIKILTPLDAVTGIKILPERNADGTIKITVSWDETKFAEKYTVYGKTLDSEWKELGNGVLGEDGWYFNTNVNINTEYAFKVTATADGRGTVSNEETFLWTETLSPASDETETYLNTVGDGTFVSGDYLVTDVLGASDFTTIATAKDGYNLEIVKPDGNFFGTGTKFTVGNDTEKLAEYTLIVKGDVTGDGICDALDCTLIEKLVNGNSTECNTVIFAADITGDGKITAADYQAALLLL